MFEISTFRPDVAAADIIYSYYFDGHDFSRPIYYLFGTSRARWSPEQSIIIIIITMYTLYALWKL